MQTRPDYADVLRKPFKDTDLKLLPVWISEDKTICRVVPYVTARAVIQRLNDAFGEWGWEEEYELGEHAVKCSLSVTFRFEEKDPVIITHVDYGSYPAPQKTMSRGDIIKGGTSDALKRAAVKFGIGVYLYDSESAFVDYDQKKRLPKAEACHREDGTVAIKKQGGGSQSQLSSQPQRPSPQNNRNTPPPASRANPQSAPQSRPQQDVPLLGGDQMKMVVDQLRDAGLGFDALQKAFGYESPSRIPLAHCKRVLSFILNIGAINQICKSMDRDLRFAGEILQEKYPGRKFRDLDDGEMETLAVALDEMARQRGGGVEKQELEV